MINADQVWNLHVHVDQKSDLECTADGCGNPTSEVLVSIDHDDCSYECNNSMASVKNIEHHSKSEYVTSPVMIRKSIRELLRISFMLAGMLIVLNSSSLMSSINLYVSFAIFAVLGTALGLLMVFCNLEPFESKK